MTHPLHARPALNEGVAEEPTPRAVPRAPAAPDASADGETRHQELPQVLTADELAALLRVNRKTIYAGFRTGEIPGGRRIGGTIRFSRDAVLRWLAEGQVLPRGSR